MNMEIRKWVMWCFDYNHDFIEKAWAESPIMSKHFRSKFDAIYKNHGCDAAMNRLYSELDDTNREILERYVDQNYHG